MEHLFLRLINPVPKGRGFVVLEKWPELDPESPTLGGPIQTPQGWTPDPSVSPVDYSPSRVKLSEAELMQ